MGMLHNVEEVLKKKSFHNELKAKIYKINIKMSINL